MGVLKMIRKIYNNIKSRLVWKAAMRMLHYTLTFRTISEGVVTFEDVKILRRNREYYRRVIAYQLAEKDEFRQQPDFYWHKTKTFSMKNLEK
jgi:hypothetical protein